MLQGGQGNAVAHHVGAKGVAKAVRIGLPNFTGAAMITE